MTLEARFLNFFHSCFFQLSFANGGDGLFIEGKKKKSISTRWKHGKSNWRMIITCQCFFGVFPSSTAKRICLISKFSVTFQPCLWIHGLIFAPKVSIWLLGFLMIIELSSCSSKQFKWHFYLCFMKMSFYR